MSGKGNRPVEITLPAQASDNARANIPSHAVPKVAAALRQQYGESENGQPDDEYVADKVMDMLREMVTEYEYGEAIRAAHQSVERPEPEF
jgi:hypothetical protein